jgi:hypothetical protein
MTNQFQEAINCNDGDQAARLIQDALGIESDDVRPLRNVAQALRYRAAMHRKASAATRSLKAKRLRWSDRALSYPSKSATLAAATAKLGGNAVKRAA